VARYRLPKDVRERMVEAQLRRTGSKRLAKVWSGTSTHWSRSAAHGATKEHPGPHCRLGDVVLGSMIFVTSTWRGLVFGWRSIWGGRDSSRLIVSFLTC